MTLNSSIIATAEDVTHLGITRDTCSKHGTSQTINHRISLARNTAYALMGAGLHGLNGLNPIISNKIYITYVLPRLLYGLESIVILKKDLTKLSMFHKKFLKNIQHLPDRTGDPAVFLLLGQLPLEAHLHKKILTFLGSILHEPTIEREIAIRQLAIKARNSHSWFVYVQQITSLYNLPSPHDLLDDTPGKFSWKTTVDTTIDAYWRNLLLTDLPTKSSLRYINPEKLQDGQPHLVWQSAGHDPLAITRASTKAKLLTGTYILQANRSKFNQHSVSSTCPLCNVEAEDRTHFLVRCISLNHRRIAFLDELEACLGPELWTAVKSSDDELTTIILDSSKYPSLRPDQREQAETISRGLCHALHSYRSSIINKS